jgi:hypothetical protein
MADPADVTLRRPSADAPPPAGSGFPIWPIVVAVAVLSVVGGWYWLRSSRDAPARPGTAAGPAPAPGAPTAAETGTPLPPLGEMDPLVRQLVSALSSHPRVLAWLTTDDLVRNVAVSVQNVADGATPSRHLKPVAPEGAFLVTKKDGRTVLDPRGYRRYDAHADAVASLDAAGVARLYATLKPRLEEAHKELSPGGSFDASLQRAIATLVSTPIIEDPVPVEPDCALYKFADPTLEALTPAQRQLLRMGPRNMRLIQQKLREIAAEIGRQ